MESPSQTTLVSINLKIELDRDIKLISVNFTKFALIPLLEAVLRLNDKGEPVSSLAGPDLK